MRCRGGAGEVQGGYREVLVRCSRGAGEVAVSSVETVEMIT